MFALGVFWDGRAGYCASSGTVNGCFVDPDTSNVLIQGQVDSVTGRRIGGALEAQSVGPPVSPVEMACTGQNWPKIHAKLAKVVPLAKAQTIPSDMQAFITAHHSNYPEMFADVYGATNKVNSTDQDNVINTRRIAYAIATHERRLKSDQTPWDQWNAGDSSAMTADQIEGFRLFMTTGRCNLCHTPPLFTDISFHFLGFHDPTLSIDQSGLEKITNSTSDKGKFKTPSLRNVGLRERPAGCASCTGGLLHSGDGLGHDLATVMALYKAGGLRGNANILPLIDQ
jgi:cytochrome c peroxidase